MEKGEEMSEEEDEWEIVPRRSKGKRIRGSKCGECGMKFETGKAYGFCCQNSQCPMGFGPITFCTSGINSS